MLVGSKPAIDGETVDNMMHSIAALMNSVQK